MKYKFALAAGVLAISLAFSTGAHAGRSCESKPPSAQSIERGLALAEQTQRALDGSGAQVVLLARAGQDLSKYGLRYSHFGFAYKTTDAQGGQVWRVLHKLNQCGTADSAIYRQGLGEFFLDDLWRFEAAWSVPHPEAQQRLMALLQDERRAVSMNHKPYNIVSYVWSERYQQSNQWAIETIAQAMDPNATTRGRAQTWLQANGYQPTTLKLGALTRLGGRMTAANVAFDDHPNEKRFSDRIETVTVDSVFSWVQRSGLGSAPVTQRLH